MSSHALRPRPLARCLHFLCIATLLALTLTSVPIVNQPVLAAVNSPESTTDQLKPNDSLDLSSGFQRTLGPPGRRLTLGNENDPMLQSACLPYAFQVDGWHALSNQGVDDSVYTLAKNGSDWYVGGDFRNTGDGSLTNLGNIARGELALSEIQVWDGTTAIPNGTGRVNFGATTVGTPIDKTFNVVNSSSADLILTEPISVPTGFSLLSSFGSITVTAGNSTTFSVRLDAASDGAYTGTLQFENNVPDENPFNFTVDGSVIDDVVMFYMPVVMKAE